MLRAGGILRRALFTAIIVVAAAGGCASTGERFDAPSVADHQEARQSPDPSRSAAVVRTSYQSDPTTAAPAHPRAPEELAPSRIIAATPAGDLPDELTVLESEALVALVEQRNPSLQAMTVAWQAATERYPQAVALDDPMLMAMLAPAALGDSSVSGGQQIQVTQRFPWPGKRRARGDAAQGEADAAYQEVEDARLALRLLTQAAFYDFFLTREFLRLNQENEAVMQRLRDAAQIRYENNLVTQQDVLQAELELHELARRRLELVRMQRVAAARINTLLWRPPSAPLPPLAALSDVEAPGEASQLIGQALAQRPDLLALGHRVEAAQAALTLACKDFYPDLDLIGAYNAMMPEKEMWGQVGVGMNIPLDRWKRQAAVAEAELTISQRVAEYEQKQLDIQYEVQSAFERLEESRQTRDLFRQKLTPTAQLNVEATQANYENAKATFLDLATAQRQLVELREQEQEAIVACHQRRAELERAVGSPIVAAP